MLILIKDLDTLEAEVKDTAREDTPAARQEAAQRIAKGYRRPIGFRPDRAYANPPPLPGSSVGADYYFPPDDDY